MVSVDPILFNIFVLIASLVIIFKAADLLIYGITRYAKKFGLSDLVIGLVVVAIAASMPELVSSLAGLVLGHESILFGTILGTNMVHLALVLGVLAVVGKKIKLESKILGKSVWILWLVLLTPFVLILWDGRLGRIDGIILIIFYVMYLGWLWSKERKSANLKKSVKLKYIWKDALIFILSLVAILIAGRWLVFSAVNLAGFAGLPTYFIAITVLAVGGALPDFAVGLKSIFKGHQDVGVGDILGSVALEFLLFFGIIGLISPISVNIGQILNATIFLVISLTLMIYFLQKRFMTRKHGIMLLGIYALFIIIEIIKLV